ncbi:MAG: VWA domain-containing protein [Thermoanaerobaculia bacterium]
MKRVLLPALLSTLAAALAFAVRTNDAVREYSSVTLVEVPVNVTGRDGKPIRGLTAGDFSIEDEGTPEKISAVDVVDLSRLAERSALPESLPAAGRRHFVLLFDLSFAKPMELVRSREAALHFVASALAPSDLAAVAVTSVESGARLLVTFTSDKHQLESAITNVGLPGALDQVRDPLQFAFDIPGGNPYFKDIASITDDKPGNAGEFEVTMKALSVAAQRNADEFSVSRVTRHLGEMGSLATALDTIEGRKTVIYFSDGFDGSLLVGNIGSQKVESAAADNEAMFHGLYWMTDVDKRYANSPLQRELDDTLKLFRRSDCVIYSIDIAGLKAEADVSLTQDAPRGEAALFAFANGTGGELIQHANDLDAQMHRVQEMTSVTYVLSYTPTSTLGEGKFHRLKVKVRRRGARVSARAGYYETRGYSRLTPLERSLAAADVITHERSGGDFPMDVLAVPLSEGPVARIPIFVHLPGLQEPKAGVKGPERLGIYVYLTDASGKLSDYFTRLATIDPTRDGGRSRQGVTFYGTCRALPGFYRARVYVRDETTGRFAFRVVPITISEPGDTGLEVLPPVFLDSAARGLFMRDASSGAGDSEPFQIGGEVVTPETAPVLTRDGHVRVCVFLYGHSAEPSSPYQISGEVVAAGGRDLSPAHMTLIGRSAPDARGLTKVLLEFSAAGLPEGAYSLRVKVSDAADAGSCSQSETKFRVS